MGNEKRALEGARVVSWRRPGLQLLFKQSSSGGAIAERYWRDTLRGHFGAWSNGTEGIIEQGLLIFKGGCVSADT